MTKFSDFINGLGVHSELLTLESKMRDEISSRYEALVEKQPRVLLRTCTQRHRSSLVLL